MNWYLKAMKNYAVISGRASRKEFWMFYIFANIIVLLIYIMGPIAGVSASSLTGLIIDGLAGLIGLVHLIPSISINVRRLHDTGHSGLWIIVPIDSLVLLLKDSQYGENKYGPSPKDNIAMTDNIMLKKFGSIKVAIVLLILLIAASIIGTLVPQGLTQNQYREKYGESRYSAMTKLQLLDVYHSYWYRELLYLFCLNMVTCSLINLKPLANVLRNKNYVSDSTDLSKKAFYKEIPVPSKTNQAKLNETSRQIKNIFSRSLYKLKYSDESINYFEKGKISRLGPFVTHASIILILIGGMLVGRLGFNEYINVPVKSTVDVPRTNFQIRADSFKADFYPDLQTPKEYTSELTIIDNGVEKITKKSIEVNKPLKYRGISFYLSSYGAMDNATSDSVGIELSKKSPDKTSSEIIGTYDISMGHDIQVPNTQLTIKLADYVLDFVRDDSGNVGSRTNEPNNPAALIELYEGEALKYKSWIFQKFPGFHAQKESEYSLNFVSIGSSAGASPGYYTGLQVSKSPFLFVVWSGFFIMVVGMFLSFYMPYKRIWVKTSSNKIEIGGSSYKNRTGFDKESNRLNALLNRL